jgi:hypothetical protein
MNVLARVVRVHSAGGARSLFYPLLFSLPFTLA